MVQQDLFYFGGMIRSMILFLGLSCFTTCQQRQSQLIHSDAQQQIESLLENYYETMSARDWEAYRSFFIEEAILTTIWAADSGSAPSIYSNSISEFIALTKDGPDSQPIFEEKMISSEIIVKHELAQAWVKYEAKFGSNENLMEWQGTDLFSFISHNDQWKIVSITFAQE